MTALTEGVLFDVPDDWWRYRCCPVCGCALSITATHTYAVQRQGWVKVGATSNVQRRLNELARPAWKRHLVHPESMDWHEPLVILGVVEGDIEHEVHRRFADAHVVGEWFLPHALMRDWLDSLTSPVVN